MFEIFAESHKLVATQIHESVFEIYGIKLDKDKLLWGSVAPDVLPRYRFIRHYKGESLNFIAKEIMKIIFIGRRLDIDRGIDPFTLKLLSKKIGIISHYLSDYVCLPHAKRWTFTDSMIKHIRYESRLNEYALSHDFSRNVIYSEDIDIYEVNVLNLKKKIKEYIDNIVEEYLLKSSFKNDLNFALSLNLKISYFILDTIESHSEEVLGQFSLVF